MCFDVAEDFATAHQVRLYADAVSDDGVEAWSMRLPAYEDGGWWAGFGYPTAEPSEPDTATGEATGSHPRQSNNERPETCESL
jgi:hypothetical protein